MIKKTSCEAICCATICLGVPERQTSKRDKKASKEMEGTVHDKGSAPAGSILSLEHEIYPIQQFLRHKDKKYTWNNAAE